MKLLKLGLLAYGPFSDETLDFCTDVPTLHMIFGPNEAGKSTALRAITGLLYGIDERTTDAHVHLPKALRILGEIEHADGERLTIVRRKGRKGTLLDGEGAVMDEALLQRALAGVSKQLFTTMFGLDHRSLRAGAHALLEGGGEVGESLFDAGGARGVHRVLKQLRAEADELFKSRGRNQKLPQALRELKQAREAIERAEMLPEGFLRQKQHLADRKAERDTLVAQRQQLAAQRHRLERLRTILPHLARLREVRARLRSLEEVPLWLLETRKQREQAAADIQLGEQEVLRLTRQCQRLRQQLAQLSVNEALAALPAARLTEVQNALGNHRQAAQHLPKRQGQLLALKQDVLDILQHLDKVVPFEEVEQLRLSAASEARLDALVIEHPRLVAQLAAAKRALAAASGRAALLNKKLATTPAPPALGPLQAAWRRAQQAAGREQRRAEALQQNRASREQLLEQRAALGLTKEGTAEGELSEGQLCALRWPSVAQVEGLQAEREALARTAEQLAEKRRALGEERERCQVLMDTLKRTGALPSGEQLRRLRHRRDELFRDWRQQGDGWSATRTGQYVDAYLKAVKLADNMADGLWQQAERVAQASRLEAELLGYARSEEALNKRAQEQTQQLEEWRRRWQALWQGLPLQLGEPRQMLAWLARFEQWRAGVQQWRQAEAQQEQLTAEMRRQRAELLQAWQLVAPEARDDGSYQQLLDAARQAYDGYKDVQKKREQWLQDVEQLALEQQQLHEEHDECLAQWERWQRQWGEQLARLGLPPEASVEEVTAVRARLRELFDKVKDARAMQQRIAGIERDAQAFDALVVGLTKQLSEDAAATKEGAALAENATEMVAERLLTRAREASLALAERNRLRAELLARETESIAAQERLEKARGAMHVLLQRAGVETVGELVRLEDRAGERQQLEVQAATVEEALLQAGDGKTIAELMSFAQGQDADDADARLQTLAETLSQLNDSIDRLNVDIGNHQHGLEKLFLQREGAYAAALDKQTCVAKVRRYAERYAQLKLATVILEQEIERYRQLNQGPIVRRTSELFARLTLGRYAQLRVDYAGGDEPELRCCPAQGNDVSIDGLSDGTRDQLYLALRLASLERYAQRAQMMPLVLDDILVHFDDERARAALQVLAQLTPLTQVLFFTHHNRLLELAREVVPAAGLREHRLIPPRLGASVGGASGPPAAAAN